MGMLRPLSHSLNVIFGLNARQGRDLLSLSRLSVALAPHAVAPVLDWRRHVVVGFDWRVVGNRLVLDIDVTSCHNTPPHGSVEPSLAISIQRPVG